MTPAMILGMLANLIQILGMVAALNGSTGVTVDRVEGTVSVLCADTACIDVPASWVGPEGTTYGTVARTTADYSQDNGGTIKL